MKVATGLPKLGFNISKGVPSALRQKIGQEPKIAQVKIRPLSNGVHVTHVFKAPHASKQFVFQSPAKMVQHLKRIKDTAWLHPMQDPANRTATVLDLGETP